MNYSRATLIIAATWLVSLAAAFYAGRVLLRPEHPSQNSRAGGADHLTAADHRSTQGRLGQPASAKTGAAPLSSGGQHAEKPPITAHAKIPVGERLEAIMDLPNPVDRMDAFMKYIGSLQGAEDFTLALDQLQKNYDGYAGGRERSLLLAAWAKSDPVAALAYTEKLPADHKGWAQSSVLAVWAQNDPEAAKAYALKNNPEENKEDNWLMAGVISGLARTDLDKAIAWSQEMPRSRARGEMMERIVDSFIRQRGLEAAKAWVLTLPEGAYRDGTLRKVAWRLTEKDTAAAAQFVGGLPSGEGRSNAMSDLVDHWAGHDPNAAGTWLNQWPKGVETDGPRGSFAWRIREEDPESAVAWAQSITDQQRREKMVVEVMRDWRRRDREAVVNFMDRNGWPEEQRRRVLR